MRRLWHLPKPLAGRGPGRVSVGSTISGIGHVALIGWLLLGWGLSHDPIPFEVTEVSVVSGEEYAQIVAVTTPDAQTDTAPAPDMPLAEEAPPAPLTEDVAPTPVAPEPAPPAPAEDSPPPLAPDPVPAPAEVTDVVPDLAPQPLETAPPQPDLDVGLRPIPRPADRVAPQAVEAPPPDTAVADVVQQEVAPEAEEPAEVVEEEQQAAAPEEAADQIVTEADEPASAPLTALRPQSRPVRTAAAEPETQTEAEAPSVAEPDAPTSDPVADAVAAALADVAASEAPASEAAGNPGPPMTGSERDAFRVSVENCWNVDTGSEASRVIISVGFELGRDGKVAGDIRLISNSDGPPAAVSAAFETARRAILRCQTANGANGFPLPPEKFEQWREVVMNFDPQAMTIR